VFWKVGLTYAALLLVALLVFNFYAETAARQSLLAVSLVVLLVGIAVTFLFGRSFSARADRLKQFSERIADGDFRPLQLVGPDDELEDLGDSLNETAGRLEREIRLLSGERNRSSAILRSMVEGVAVIDAKERMVF